MNCNYIPVSKNNHLGTETSLAGLEPATFGLEVQRAFHCATETCTILETLIQLLIYDEASRRIVTIFLRQAKISGGTRTSNLRSEV